MATPKDKDFWSIRAEKSVVDNNIDWSTVASKVTTELETIRDERQQRKDAIDEATNSMMNELAKGEDINNATLSTALIDGGQSASEALQIQVDLMKKGLIKPKDYKIFLQKQQNAYTNLKNVVQNWDKWDTKSRERLAVDPNTNQQIASQIEIDFNESTSAFGNMENIKFIPTETGGMEAVRLVDDGSGNMVLPNRQDHPDNFMNPNVIGARQRFELNRINIPTAMKAQVDALGAFLETDGGRIFKSTNDLRQSDKYQDSKRLSINAVLGGEPGKRNAMASANVAGNMGYRFAQSEQQKKKMMEEEGIAADMIIMYTSTDGSPKFADDAFDNIDLEGYLGDQFDILLADETKLTKGIDPTKPTREEVIVDEKEKKLGTDIRNLNNILTSEDPDDVQGNLEALIESYNATAREKGKYGERGIVGYVLNDGEIQFKFANGDVSNSIARQTNGPDGLPNTGDEVDVAINNQIYQLGQLLNPTMFQNQVEVDDWIANDDDFVLGTQRGITKKQVEELLKDPERKADVIKNWQESNPKNKGKQPSPTQLRQHAEDMFEDSLDVDFQMKDYDYDTNSVSSETMKTIPVDGVKRTSPADGTGDEEITVEQFAKEMLMATKKMLPQALQDDLRAAGGDISVDILGGTGGFDDNQDDVNIKLTFKNPDGTVETFTIDKNSMSELTGEEDIGEISFNEYFKTLDAEFVTKIKDWGKKFRGSKRGQSGKIGKKKFN